jgi:Flp pilus assembly protein TadB
MPQEPKRARTLEERVFAAIAIVGIVGAIAWRLIWTWTGPTADTIFFVVIGIGVIAGALLKGSRGE